MKKNYLFPQAEICLIREEDIITTSFTIDLTSTPDIGQDDCVDFTLY